MTNLSQRSGLYLWATRIALALFSTAMFLILVKLGFWQLDRAEMKEQWQSELTQRQSSAPLTYDQLVSFPPTEQITGYRLSVLASPATQNIFLLDNQVFNGRVGYLALQPIQVTPDGPWMLVELGFVPAGLDRRILPKVKVITGEVSLNGRLYQKQANPMSSALMPEPGWPKRIQNLNINAISQLLDQPLAPAVLQPDHLDGFDLPHPWTPIPLSSQKHRGYALQWFSMALAFALLILYFIYSRRSKASTKQQDEVTVSNNSDRTNIDEMTVANENKTK
ncbi:SURF1 family protein [Shewanella eurypsychrophilus]|uniref:SURF1-like protein n=1 Tax=Shewanella eurypsychrophilus TaxID=2593656 RepID=A0ABX6V0Q9_9GAMM|nr:MULTISPECIES: SURF1 family protein [Shewanella]QFU20597.1 SURF1 family protein [Shewanella sp. YLB-09]QFU20878.1 SURF1 family protein [Shewanella sp. YLB-09]QPG56167.1 SURF1 family protein [Shewanella eurypsychrophilus]